MGSAPNQARSQPIFFWKGGARANYGQIFLFTLKMKG